MLSDFLGTLSAAFLIGLVDAFIFNLLRKWSVWEYLQVHADAWFSWLLGKDSDLLNRAFSCTFCLTWWISVLFSLLLSVIEGEAWYLVLPVFASPIAKKLVE